LEGLEDRTVPSNIVWTNRGQVSDGFAAEFGADAAMARADIDAALSDWATLITNFNYASGPDTFNVNISIGGSGFGASTSYGGSWQIGGKPNQASIGIGGGNPSGTDHGWYVDPSPTTYEEFEGNIITPYTLSATPGGPADGKFDLYSIVAIEFAHAAGLNDATNELFTSDPNHYLTNTGQSDVACPGTLWTYRGPDVNALFTSDNGCSQNRSNALHTALPNVGNQVTSGGITYYGADDIDVPVYFASRRYMPSNLAAQVLHDSYGYTISAPTYHSAYIDYNPATHNVLVRDGSHGTGIYPSQNNPSNDVITVFTFSIPFPINQTFIAIDVQIGNPTPGTGPNPTYGETFLASSVSSITVNTTDGVDTVNLDNTFALFAPVAPVTVNLGTGTATVNILNLPPNPQVVTVNLGSGADTVNIQSTFAPVTVNGGSGTDIVNVERTNAPVTLTLFSNNATVNVGHNGTVQDINGAVTIENPPSFNVINIDDSADPASHLNIIMDSFTPSGDTPFGRITGLAPAAITYEFEDTNTLNIKTGTGSTVVNVLATGAILGTNLFSNGATTVNIGNANSLWVGPGIGGPLNLENEVSSDTVFINDQNDTTSRSASLATVVQKGCTCGRLTGLSAAPISWDYPDTTMVNINTGRGGVTFTVLGTGVPTFINGNTLGTNTLIGGNLLTTWHVNTANAGTLSNALASATFSGFQNLTSGSGSDGFVFSNAATLSGTLNGAGASGLSLAPYTTDLTVNITGGGAGNIPGVVPNFLGIQYLTAGSGSDRFVFTSAGSITSIDGGVGGTDTLDFSAVSRNLSVLVYGANAGTVPGTVFEFADIENVTGGSGNNTFVFTDGASLAGTLTGGSGNNLIDASPCTTGRTFSITGANGGSVASMVGSFANVQNLIGAGAGGNSFAFFDGGSLAGRLDGGVGTNNTLDYSLGWSGIVMVNLQTGAASGVAGQAINHLANIQNVLGANGGGAGFYNILVGDGNNYLQGGTGRTNLVIAGGSAGTLVAGNVADILIGGITLYDGEADMHSLAAIMNYWSTTADPFSTMVVNVTTGNGVPRLDATTVTGNGGGNNFVASGALALIYSDNNDTTTGSFDPNSQTVAITP
jgi:hypothetical protein